MEMDSILENRKNYTKKQNARVSLDCMKIFLEMMLKRSLLTV